MQKPLPPPVVDLVLHPERDREYVHFEAASEHPFLPRPAEVGRRNAWWLADAALLAYWDEAEVRRRAGAARMDARLLDRQDVQCAVAWTPEFVIAAFRGTQPNRWHDVLDDALFVPVTWQGEGRVHQGFKGALERIWDPLLELMTPLASTRAVWFTGHSLGAALATLAAARFERAQGVCTIGSPRVGDAIFAAAFDTRFGPLSLRYVQGADIVTHVPPPLPYEHVAQLRHVERDGSISGEPPRLAHFFPDLIGESRHLAEMASLLDAGALRTAPRFFLDHMPRAYAVHLWNDYDAHRR